MYIAEVNHLMTLTATSSTSSAGLSGMDMLMQ